MLHRAHETFTEAGTVPRTSRTAALWAGGVHQLAGQDAQILIVCGRLHQARVVFQLQLPANFACASASRPPGRGGAAAARRGLRDRAGRPRACARGRLVASVRRHHACWSVTSPGRARPRRGRPGTAAGRSCRARLATPSRRRRSPW
ncbi:hypothetical protein StrepF001_11240 [Streptomyces sp. F001]|nr:hypothetical protein StrepF001_11240 [Streptomyces sp. F001]